MALFLGTELKGPNVFFQLIILFVKPFLVLLYTPVALYCEQKPIVLCTIKAPQEISSYTSRRLLQHANNTYLLKTFRSSEFSVYTFWFAVIF